MKSKRYLHRKRMHSVLSPVFEYPITILEAPMGYGKTTAVRSFLEEETANAIWFTFSDLKQSREVLWNRFTDEIEVMDSETGKTLKSLGLPSSIPQLERFIQILSQINFFDKFILVLDDYQNAHDDDFNNLLLQLAQEEIEGFHILIITRDTSDIDFIELLSRGLCHIITQNQLRFSPEELADYCRLYLDSVSEEDLENIYHYTDGWISFAYIIMLGLEKGIPVGMSTTVEDLIEKALFLTYPSDIRKLLLKLSVMEDFTVQQAEFVTEEPTIRQCLKRLSKENTFIYYDEKTGIYKIHHVLLDFLRVKQNFTAEEKNELYLRLSDWYLGKKEFQTAYGYLNEIGQTERILVHLNNPKNIQNVQFTFRGVHEMFNRTPRELLLQYPIAYLVYIMYTMVTGREDEVMSWEDRLDEIEQYYSCIEGIDATYRNRILGEVLIVRKFTLFNHIREMKASNLEIMRLLNGQNSYITTQDHEFTFGSPHYLYIYYREIGSFKTIAELLTENVGYAEFSNGCGSGCDSLAAAEYALETGDIDQVERNLNEAMRKAQLMSQTAVMICVDFCLVRLRIVQGNLSEALELLSSMQKRYEIQNNSLSNTTLDLCKGYIFASIGQPEQIPAWLQLGNMTEANFMYQGIAYNYLVYGKALMAAGKFVELEALIVPFRKCFSIFSNQLGHIHNKIFEAVAKYHSGKSEVGLECMEAALLDAAPDKLIMPFVESAPYIVDMLQIILDKNPNDNDVRLITTLCQKYIQTITTQPRRTVVMTQRELDILSLSAKGLKRKDIAERLFITEETVKSHFKNIYLKLEVNSKLSAIQIAQSRGYLSQTD